jgi:hypothetical protein
MAQLAPPGPPPQLLLAEDDGRRRFRFRLQQVSLSVLTLFITAWFISLGPIPGILAVLVAKHVLVAILLMGLGVDAPKEADVR